MTDLIMNIASVIQTEVNSINSVAQNAANANTVGYRATRSFSTLSGAPSATAAVPGIATTTSIDTADGALRQTRGSTDLALSGDAWFVVNTPAGERLTRDGQFHIGSDGALLTRDGFQVMGTDGVIKPEQPFSVATDGSISNGKKQVGQFRLVSAQNPASIRLDTSGMYVTDSALLPASHFLLHQGALEQSNVSLSSDMARLVEVTRHIESMQRALSAYDNLLNTGINQLGKE